MTETPIKLELKPEQIKPFRFSENPNADVETLEMLGIGMDASEVKKILSYAYDIAPNLITSPSISNQLQFFQHFLPKTIEVVTQKRVSDDLLGIDIAGNWYDEEIVFRIQENVAKAQVYSDMQNVPLSSWNLNFEKRTIVRGELGLRVGTLESERAGAMRISSEDTKRKSLGNALEIFRNLINFYGYLDGQGKTYGILNAPELPAYTTVAQGVSKDTKWSSKTYDEILSDIKTAAINLRASSGYNFDPFNDPWQLWIAGSCIDYLGTPNSLGTNSVLEYVQAHLYKKMTVKAVPQFNGADSGENVFYAVAESIESEKTVAQYVQTKLRLIGQKQLTKGFEEDYSNATAGFVCKMPTGIGRYSGI